MTSAIRSYDDARKVAGILNLNDVKRLRHLGTGASGNCYFVQHDKIGERTRFALKVVSVDSAELAEHQYNRSQNALRFPPHSHVVTVVGSCLGVPKGYSEFPDGFCGTGTGKDALLRLAQAAREGRPMHGYCVLQEYMDVCLGKALTVASTRASGRPPVTSALIGGLILQLLLGVRGLAGFHLRHRDLKPDNVLISSREGLVKLSEFLCDLGPAVENEYLAPVHDSRVDVFAIGCIAFEVATGRRVFAQDADMPELDAELVALIHRMLVVERITPGEILTSDFMLSLFPSLAKVSSLVKASTEDSLPVTAARLDWMFAGNLPTGEDAWKARVPIHTEFEAQLKIADKEVARPAVKAWLTAVYEQRGRW